MESQTNIEHIILSGGGHIMFQEYSILKESNLAEFWKFENIKSIYGTSAGSIIGLFICLMSICDKEDPSSIKKEWETMDNYLINRPWQNLFKIDLLTVLQSINKEGILSENVALETFAPIFKAKDIPLNINMRDFFELTNCDLHFFTVDMDSFEIVDISHENYPEWEVISAVYASSCLPIIFTPFHKEGKTYTDGGVLINYPLSYFFKNNHDVNPNSILGIKNVYINEYEPSVKQNADSENYSYEITEPKPTYIYDSVLKILAKMLEFTEKHHLSGENCAIKYEILVFVEQSNLLNNIYLASNFSEERKKLMDLGKETWTNFISNII